MNRLLRLFVPGILLLSLAAVAQQPVKLSSGAPATRRDNVTETLHGVNVTDPYRWLEDQDSKETRAWIDQQNAYTHSLLGNYAGRTALQERITSLMKVEVMTAPTERNGRYFFRKRLADQDLYVIYMREGHNGKDQVLLDPHGMSTDHSTNVGFEEVSEDGKVMAYYIRQGGKDESEIRFMNVDTRKDLPDVLPAATYFNISMLPDRSGVYYSFMANDGPRIRFHKMGSDAAQDPDIFGKGYGKDKIAIADLSPDGHYLSIVLMYGSSADKTEVFVQDLASKGMLQPIIKDIDARFFPSIGGDTLFVHTNWNAPKGKVMAIDLRKPARENWRDLVPEGDAAIEGVMPAGDKLLVTYVRNATTQMTVFDAHGRRVADVKTPTLGSIHAGNGRWGHNEAFFSFNSFATPPTFYSYDTAKGTQTVWSQVKAPVDSSKFEVRQVWVTSKDGTKVPMFLVYQKGLKLDGSHPALLTGYGGFTVSMTPNFSAEAVIWAEHGGVYALANLRGGGEFGEQWHRTGMMEKKQNVFDDFIAASEWLINNKYTQSSKLAITGGSNGGLLVGAAMTQRPELYRAVICWHPLLDMLRYQKFMEAQFWVSEYGSSENAEQFKYLRAYSPYQNVKEGTKYPAVLFMTGDGDTRVAPLHARKMAALMQSATASNYPILLRYELKAGHSGGRSITQAIGDQADELSFLFDQLGIGEAAKPAATSAAK